MSVFVHPTAEIEEGVELGEGTSVWSQVHIRGPAKIGRDCIVGEKTYIAYDVSIGDRVKLNAMVYVCAGVTLEDGVMVSAGTTFTNDRYPRATTTDLSALLSSEPDEEMGRTLVAAGATLGANATIGSDLRIGRFAVVGMGSVVTGDVPDHILVVGSPARPLAVACRCGKPLHRLADGEAPAEMACDRCGSTLRLADGTFSSSPGTKR